MLRHDQARSRVPPGDLGGRRSHRRVRRRGGRRRREDDRGGGVRRRDGPSHALQRRDRSLVGLGSLRGGDPARVRGPRSSRLVRRGEARCVSSSWTRCSKGSRDVSARPSDKRRADAPRERCGFRLHGGGFVAGRRFRREALHRRSRRGDPAANPRMSRSGRHQELRPVGGKPLPRS